MEPLSRLPTESAELSRNPPSHVTDTLGRSHWLPPGATSASGSGRRGNAAESPTVRAPIPAPRGRARRVNVNTPCPMLRRLYHWNGSTGIGGWHCGGGRHPESTRLCPENMPRALVRFPSHSFRMEDPFRLALSLRKMNRIVRSTPALTLSNAAECNRETTGDQVADSGETIVIWGRSTACNLILLLAPGNILKCQPSHRRRLGESTAK